MTQHTNPVPVTAEDRVAAWPFRPIEKGPDYD